jgi:tripartite-type tricarboxylate transporter receptor subunit TctC
LRILQTPEMSARLAELGAEPASYKPDEFLAFIKRDNAKRDKLIRERKIEVERVTLAL